MTQRRERLELYWPVADFVLPGEWAREFRLTCRFFEFSYFALDHLRSPTVRQRRRSFRWFK